MQVQVVVDKEEEQMAAAEGQLKKLKKLKKQKK